MYNREQVSSSVVNETTITTIIIVTEAAAAVTTTKNHIIMSNEDKGTRKMPHLKKTTQLNYITVRFRFFWFIPLLFFCCSTARTLIQSFWTSFFAIKFPELSFLFGDIVLCEREYCKNSIDLKLFLSVAWFGPSSIPLLNGLYIASRHFTGISFK